MRRVKSLMSADTSDQLIRLGVGQKVKPRARTDDSSLESGVCDRLMTEVVSTTSYYLRSTHAQRRLH